MSSPALPRVPCGVCTKTISLKSCCRPDRRFRVGDKELHRWHPICKKHWPHVEMAYEHRCGAVVWGHPGTFLQPATGKTLEAVHYQHQGARVVRCPDCGGALKDALPVGWEERRR